MTNTKIKLCGMFREADIDVVNELRPDYIGFVFFEKSHRNVTREQAAALKVKLDPSIQVAGVFVDAELEFVIGLLEDGIIDIAQLHGHEDDAYIEAIRNRTGKTVFQAFKVRAEEDVRRAEASAADYILLDNGKGTGARFDWSLIRDVKRPYFLAGGLDADNVADAVADLKPYGVDVSSGIETDKIKDKEKMRKFVTNVRKA